MTGGVKTFWDKYGVAMIGVVMTMTIQLVLGLVALGMILQQIADLRGEVQELQRDRAEQGKALVRSETRLDGIDRSLVSIESLIRQVITQKLGSLP